MSELIQWAHTEAVMREYADKAVALYKGKLEASKHVATGDLLNSVRTVVVTGGQSIAVDISMAEWWKWVEYDTRPHWAPSGVLLPWIEAKGIPTHATKGDGLPTPKSLDFLIRRKIATVGTKGSHDLYNTVEELNEEYAERIADAVTQDVGAMADVIIQTFAGRM